MIAQVVWGSLNTAIPPRPPPCPLQVETINLLSGTPNSGHVSVNMYADDEAQVGVGGGGGGGGGAGHGGPGNVGLVGVGRGRGLVVGGRAGQRGSELGQAN